VTTFFLTLDCHVCIAGPEVWARLFPQAGGARQSPVDIATSIASGDSKLEERKLTVNYQTKDGLRMLNTGQGWKVEAPMPESSKCFTQI
jgi:carbonic anhydrase